MPSVKQKTVWLNNRKYTVRGNPQRRLISQLPGKVTLGDYNIDSNPVASVVVWSDHRGGIGIENYDASTTQDRTWYSDLSLRHKNHLVLQRRAVATADNAALGDPDNVQFVAELGASIYALSGLNIYLYDNTADSWGSSLNTFAASPSDVLTAPVAGTNTLIVAQNTAPVDWTTDGSSWTDEAVTSTNIQYLAWGYRNYLWGIDSNGVLYRTHNLTVGWTAIADGARALQAFQGSPTKLFVGPGPAGEDLLYCATQVGLFVYDNANERFVPTPLELPYHNDNGVGAFAFRGSIYVNAGMSIYKYTPGAQTIITLMGPDRDDGLPTSERGIVQYMAGTHNDLIVTVNGASTGGVTPPSEPDTITDGIHTGMVLGGGIGRSQILGFNELGWEVKWRDSVQGANTSNLLVSSAYSSYRMWWASGNTVYYASLPVGIQNPSQVETTQRNASGTWEGPWFDAGAVHQDKTALAFHLDSDHPSNKETVELKYRTNYDDSDSATVSLGTKITSGDTQYKMPNDTTPTGVVFRAIKPILEFNRGGILTSTPDVKKVAMVYKRTLETLWGWDFLVDATELTTMGYTPEQIRDTLFGTDTASLINTRTLVPFSLKDEPDGDQDYYVFLVSVQGEERTGYDDGALWRVTVAEALSQ